MTSDPSQQSLATDSGLPGGWAVRAQGAVIQKRFENKSKETKTFAKQLKVLDLPPPARPSYTITLHLKIRDNAWAWLDQAAREVNQVWNWANAASRDALRPFTGFPYRDMPHYGAGGQWLSSVDLCAHAVGAGECFERIGNDVIQRVIAEFVTRRTQFRKTHLRFRVSGGGLDEPSPASVFASTAHQADATVSAPPQAATTASPSGRGTTALTKDGGPPPPRRSPRKSLGWIPFKAANLRVNGNRLTFMGKSIRLFQMDRFLEHRQAGQAKMRGGNFAQNALGEWFLNVTVDVYYPEGTTLTPQGLPMLPVAPNDSVGIDPGLTSVWTTSHGEHFTPNRSYRETEERLAQAQQRKNRKRVQRLSRKVKYQRLDHNHKISHRIVQQYQTIYLGNVPFDVLGAGNWAKSAHDAAPSQLKTFVMDKGRRAGRMVVEVPEAYTTQVCSQCEAFTGPKGPDALGVRTWTCSACQAAHDRDVNSATNIEIRGNTPTWGYPRSKDRSGDAPTATPVLPPGVEVRSRNRGDWV